MFSCWLQLEREKRLQVKKSNKQHKPNINGGRFFRSPFFSAIDYG
jgi:hypothetical protein